MCTDPAVVIGAAAGGAIALKFTALAALVLLLHHKEKKERRALASATGVGKGGIETKTVTIENLGQQGGTAGTAQVVLTQASGAQTVTSAPVSATGAAVVSTVEAGIPGGIVHVGSGQTKVVTVEHPVGKPEAATIVSEKKQ